MIQEQISFKELQQAFVLNALIYGHRANQPNGKEELKDIKYESVRQHRRSEKDIEKTFTTLYDEAWQMLKKNYPFKNKDEQSQENKLTIFLNHQTQKRGCGLEYIEDCLDVALQTVEMTIDEQKSEVININQMNAEFNSFAYFFLDWKLLIAEFNFIMHEVPVIEYQYDIEMFENILNTYQKTFAFLHQDVCDFINQCNA